jgi:hypothetical protein
MKSCLCWYRPVAVPLDSTVVKSCPSWYRAVAVLFDSTVVKSCPSLYRAVAVLFDSTVVKRCPCWYRAVAVPLPGSVIWGSMAEFALSISRRARSLCPSYQSWGGGGGGEVECLNDCSSGATDAQVTGSTSI